MKKKIIYNDDLKEERYIEYLNETLSKEEIIQLEKDGFTYIKVFVRFSYDKEIEYNDILLKIRSYNFSKFRIFHNSYQTIIYPDDGFLFLINELNVNLSKKINLNEINISITEEMYNLIDFENGIPYQIQGLGVAYKLYILLINYFGYISSDVNSSTLAKNLWFSLVQDQRIYCITSKYYSYLICKKLNNDSLKYILDILIERKEKIVSLEDIVFDNDIKEKIIEIYGSLEFYKQKY